MTALLIALLALILPPCPTEDSSQCYWNAAEQGNGTGASFIDIGGTAYLLP